MLNYSIIGAAGGGNGNGCIEWSNESANFWNHLALAGYPYPIPGSAFYARPPKLANDAGKWLVGSASAGCMAAMYPVTGVDDVIGVAVQTAVSNPTNQPRAGAMSPENTYRLDGKFDDGRPEGGKFRGFAGHLPELAVYQSCHIDSGGERVYDIANPILACRYMYLLSQ